MININDIVLLSDNQEYIVVSKADYKNRIYYYLADTQNKGNLKFLYLDNDELVEIQDLDVIKAISPMLIDNFNVKK